MEEPWIKGQAFCSRSALPLTVWQRVSYLMSLNLSLLLRQSAGETRFASKSLPHWMPRILPLDQPWVILSCHYIHAGPGASDKNWIQSPLGQKSEHSHLLPLSADIWWPPVSTNSQSFVLPNINRVMFRPWNYEGTADGIITPGRKLGTLVQTTSRFMEWCSPHCRRSWGVFAEVNDSPFSHLPTQYPWRPRQQGEWVRTAFVSCSHPLGAAGAGRPLRMFAGHSLGHTTVRESPS